MKERPILMSAPMVVALLAGTKTQTRRAIKPQPHHVDGGVPYGDAPAWARAEPGSAIMKCPYGKRGDTLWVRESFSGPHHQERHPPRDWHALDPIHYWADGNPSEGDWTRPRPGMFMPRWASRITLEVTEIRVERLQEISEADALAEGCAAEPFPGPWWQGYREHGGDLMHQQFLGEAPPVWMIEPHRMKDMEHMNRSAVDAYRTLWMNINGVESWERNDWVWAVSFRQTKA